MADIVALDLEAIDFESAVDEVDFLVPKYLEALQSLDHAETIEVIGKRMQRVAVYWERLSLLFRQMKPLEKEVPFDDIVRSTLQSELVVLERAYLRVNLTLQMAEAAWTDDLFKVAETLLTRMDAVLLSLGFPKEHADRMFIAKVRIENQESYQRWLLRRHHVSDQDR